jgi:hypothetical protein
VYEALHALAGPKTQYVLCVCVCACVCARAQFCRLFRMYKYTDTVCLRTIEENEEEARRRIAPQGH